MSRNTGEGNPKQNARKTPSGQGVSFFRLTPDELTDDEKRPMKRGGSFKDYRDPYADLYAAANILL